MPKFNQEVSEFYEECSRSDKEDLVSYLREDGFLGKNDFMGDDEPSCEGERIFESALYKLQGLYRTVTKEDEDIIINLAKKYVY